MKRFFSFTTILLLIVAVSGCATNMSHTGSPIDESKARAIKPGTTTKAQLISTFGQPAETTTSMGEETLIFKHTEKETRSLIGGKMVYRRGPNTITTLTVTIKNGIVSHYKYSSGPEN